MLRKKLLRISLPEHETSRRRGAALVRWIMTNYLPSERFSFVYTAFAIEWRIQICVRAGVFTLRLKSEDWASGDINWLLDVIAVDQKTAGQVISNFRQVVKDGKLRMHPIITRLVDEETLEKMQQAQLKKASA